MENNPKCVEVDYNVTIDRDIELQDQIFGKTSKVHDLGEDIDNDRELLQESLGDLLLLRVKRPRKERLESIKSHLMDINIAILTTAGIVFVSLAMNMAYTAINVNPNPVCYYSANNDFKDNIKSNGDFCISTDKEDKVFYCCKGNFRWCLDPERCDATKMHPNDDGYGIANLTISGLMLLVVLFIIVMMFQIAWNFKDIFDKMYWGDWRGN